MKTIEYRFYINIVIILTLIFPGLSLAVDNKVCLKNGYTIATLNGIFTNEGAAKLNTIALRGKFGLSFNGQPIDYEYLWNQTHLAGLGDLFDAAYQKYFDTDIVTDYDLMEIFKDAASKVSTEKVLLVGHSQGNFYVNSFYDTIIKNVNDPSYKSLGVYGVASPASRVAGGGKYITSSTDQVIEKVRRLSPIMVLPANENIILPEGNNLNGHEFGDTYVKFRTEKIVNDIEYSLSKLQNNDIQIEDDSCFNPPALSITHLLVKGTLLVADPLAVGTKTVAVGTTKALYKTGEFVGNTAIDTTVYVAKTTYSVLDSIGNATIDVAKYLGGKAKDGLAYVSNFFKTDHPIADGNSISASVFSAVTPNNDNALDSDIVPSDVIKTKIVVEDKEEETLPPKEEVVETLPPPLPDFIVNPPNSEESAVSSQQIEEHPDLLPGGGGINSTQILDFYNQNSTPTSADYLDTVGKLLAGGVLYLSPAFTNPIYGRVWYQGHYPDTSTIVMGDGFSMSIILQTLGCGNICSPNYTNKIPTYYWMGIYTDALHNNLVHYDEVYDTGGLVEATRFNLVAQGNFP